MHCNVGTLDKIIRVVFGLVIGYTGYVLELWWLYVIAGALLLTAIFGFCLLYVPLKISTCVSKK
jgi:heme O synthase-like polyprenyltransferase